MKKVLAFLIAAALLLLFCVSVFGEDASSILSGSGSLPLGYSAAAFADLDPAFLAANSVGNISVTYTLSDGSTGTYDTFGEKLIVPSTGYPYVTFRFSVSGLDPDSYYYFYMPFEIDYPSVNILMYSYSSSLEGYVDTSSFPFVSILAPGSVLSSFSFSVIGRQFLSSYSGSFSASGSLFGSMYASGQGSISAGGGQITGNVFNNSFLGSLSLFNAPVSMPNYNFSSGSSVSLDSSSFSFSQKLSGSVSTFNLALDLPFVVPLSSLVDSPFLVRSFSGLASFFKSFWDSQDNNYQESINPELDDKTNEANQIVEDTENFENDIFTSADNALGEIDIENQKLPDSFSAPFLWIGQLVVALFNQLGDFKIIILFPMYLGLCLLAIGRGGQAIQRINYRGRGRGSDA